MLATILFCALALLFFSTTLYQTLTSVLLARYLEQKKALPTASAADATHPGISILIPVKGVHWDFAKSLRSILEQNYPGALEIILGVQSEADPVVQFTQKLVSELKSRVVVKYAIGGPEAGLNPKSANLSRALSVAQFDWIYCSDADVALEPSFFLHSMPKLSSERYGSTFTIHKGSPNLGAALESVGTNVEGSAFFLISSLAPEKGPMNGAAMLFHRSLLQKAGGFEAVVNKITDDLSLSAIFNSIGSRFVLLPLNVEARLPNQNVLEYWDRIIRWLLIVRCHRPVLFYSAPSVWVWQWGLLLGLIFREEKFFLICAASFVFRLLFAAFFHGSLAGWRESWKIIVIPIYDLFAPLVWLSTLFKRNVVWAGNRLVVGSDGTLERD